MSVQGPKRSARAIVLPVVGLLVLATVAVFAAMTILSEAPLASPSAVAVVSPSPAATPPAEITPSTAPEDTPADTPAPSDSPSPEPTVSALPTAAPLIQTRLLSERDPAGIWLVNIRYPSLSPASSAVAGAVNDDIKGYVEMVAAGFESGPAAVRQEPGKVNTLTGTFSVALASPRLASFRLKLVDDTSGAHPTATVETFSYELVGGSRLSFGALFLDQPAALTILSNTSRDTLRSRLGADYDPTVADDGTSPTPDNFASWAITKDGLEVTFREYQVGPYALGMPVVVVPWSALAAVVDPAGPAGPFVSQ